MYINLNSIDKVKKFVNEMSQFESDVDLISERYVINAKSIMGIFSLNLSKNIEIKFYPINEKEKEKFNKVIKQFLV